MRFVLFSPAVKIVIKIAYKLKLNNLLSQIQIIVDFQIQMLG